MALKVGDIVQLKSGGPKMTVQALDGKSCHCQWFAGSKIEHGYFPTDSLQTIQPEEGNPKK